MVRALLSRSSRQAAIGSSALPRSPSETSTWPPPPLTLLEQVAYHEASHAVTAHVLGARIARIDITASGGQTLFELRPTVVNLRRGISVSLAGTIGEQMKDPRLAGLPFAGGDRSDQLVAATIADRFARNLDERRAELQRARNRAALILSAHWPAVRAVAETLKAVAAYGSSIDGRTVRQIINSVMTGEKPGSHPGISEALRRKRQSKDWN
jgi:hypothetical protein